MIWVIGVLAVCGLVPESAAHDRPIVGVLVQEISRVFELMYPRQYTSFIAASYVKWLESGGARVVPIFPGGDMTYYRTILSKVNGVLLPGGSVDKNDRGGYTEAAENILNIAIEMNLKKDFFPVFGVGLGMDFMLYMSSDGEAVHSDCSLDSVALSLILSKKGENTWNYIRKSSETRKINLKLFSPSFRFKTHCAVQFVIEPYSEPNDKTSRRRSQRAKVHFEGGF